MSKLRNQYINYLINELEENPEMETCNLEEAIYIIDDVMVGGGFSYGSRTVDHNALAIKDYSNYEMYFKNENGERVAITWEDILDFGIVIVPEEKTYISDEYIEELEAIGYDRLPLNNNHINGYKY